MDSKSPLVRIHIYGSGAVVPSRVDADFDGAKGKRSAGKHITTDVRTSWDWALGSDEEVYMSGVVCCVCEEGSDECK